MSENANKYVQMLEKVDCNLCGANNYSVVRKPDYDSARPDDVARALRSSGDEILLDQLVKCKECGLQYLNPRLSQEIILDGYAEGIDETFISQAEAREQTFKKYLRVIERFKPARGKILDIGTAGGSFLKVAKQSGWQVFGCELNRWLAGWGSEHYGISIYPGTVFDMGLKDSSLDVVTLWDVLEHTADPKAVLLECRRLLKEKGLLVLSYPDISSFASRIMGRKWVFLLSVHLYYFNILTLKKLLEAAGFRLIRRQLLWQSLELGYILFRMKPYIPPAYLMGTKIAQVLRIQNKQVPYWMGQNLIFASCGEKE